jgi:BirA family biotin operon repressor/biotin-[acetyl-CoA-carboxylase] ligase
MDLSAATQTDNTPPKAPLPKAENVEGWLVYTVEEVASTNLLAAGLPPWRAIRAQRQSAGRGRFQRTWISNEGGLWLSAVVPMGEGRGWRALPLAVGLAVSGALRETGVRGLRMRWPNDLLVDDRKLAGLLLDQFGPGLAVAGIGINVYNHPEDGDPSLKNQTARLADLIPAPPSLSELAGLILSRLRKVLDAMRDGGTDAVFLDINNLWGPPRRVELDLDGVIRRGLFSGVDAEGNLTLLDEFGGSSTFSAHQVRHLKEILS